MLESSLENTHNVWRSELCIAISESFKADRNADLKYFNYVCVCVRAHIGVCGGPSATGCLWKSENNFRETVLSCFVGSGSSGLAAGAFPC